MFDIAASTALSHIATTSITPVLASASIDIDGTIIVQMLLFWVVLGFLHVVLFRPYLKALDAREEGVEGSREEAGEMQARASQVIEEYEEKMRQARRDATDVRESLRNQGTQEQTEMLQEVREEIRQKMQHESERIDQRVAVARQEIQARAETLANTIVQRVLPG